MSHMYFCCVHKHHCADNGPSSQSYGFSSSHVQMWELDHKEGWVPKNWCFRTVRSKQSILKETSPEYSLEGQMLKLKLPYFGQLMQRTNSLEKTLMWERLMAGGEGGDRGEMVGWHQQLNGHEFEHTRGVDDGQGSLACCSPCGCKESDTTVQLNWTVSRRSPRGGNGNPLQCSC